MDWRVGVIRLERTTDDGREKCDNNAVHHSTIVTVVIILRYHYVHLQNHGFDQ